MANLNLLLIWDSTKMSVCEFLLKLLRRAQHDIIPEVMDLKLNERINYFITGFRTLQ